MYCCDEYGCRRKQPIRIYLGDLTGQVFAATRSRVARDNGDGTAAMIASEKHDVTEQVRSFIRRNPEWVAEALSDAASSPNRQGDT